LHPDLIRIGPFTLHAYGTALALSFLLGVLLARWRARRRGVAEGDVLDLFQLIVLSSIVGARFFFVVFHLDAYQGRWWHMFALWEGGLTLYGGLLLALFSSAVFLRRRRIPFLRMADVMSPSLGLGILITRIGCFLNGCCFGLPTDSAFGVHFPASCEATHTARDLLLASGGGHEIALNPSIHPAQLYSAFGGLVILLVLLLAGRRSRPVGFTFANFLLLYGVHRFAIDQFRYYEEAMRVLSLSVNQWLSLALVVAGLLLHRHLRVQTRAEA